MSDEESAPLDPQADDGQEVRQDAAEPIKGRDRPLWWKIRQDAPEPPGPHPDPILTTRDPLGRGTFLPNTGLRGWSTLMHRVGPGWTVTETHAIGWKLGAYGRVGALTETIGVRARHAATGANAIAFLERPIYDPTVTTDEDPDRKPWGFKNGMAWVEDCPGRGPTDGRVQAIQARPFAAALKGEPPLITDEDGRLIWPRYEVPNEEESEE